MGPEVRQNIMAEGEAEEAAQDMIVRKQRELCLPETTDKLQRHTAVT